MSTPPEAPTEGQGSLLATVSNKMTSLHREHFGRGPSRTRSGWVDGDTLVVTMRDALLPAEQEMTRQGQVDRFVEPRLHSQEAPRRHFIDAVAGIVGRDIASFASACDPRTEVVWEIFEFEPRET